MRRYNLYSARFLISLVCVQIVSVLHLSSAHALPPSRSNLCMSIVSSVSVNEPSVGLKDLAYTIISVDSIRRNLFTYEDVQPSALSEGFYLAVNSRGQGARRQSEIERSSSGFGRMKVAERLEGIVRFSQMGEMENGQRSVVRVATFRGESEIGTFLDIFRLQLSYAERTGGILMEERHFGSGVILGASALALPALPAVFPSLNIGDLSVTASLIGAFVVSNLAVGTDGWLRRQAALDRKFEKELSVLVENLFANPRAADQNMVGLLSRNVMLAASVSDGLMNSSRTLMDNTDHVMEQTKFDQFALIDKLVGNRNFAPRRSNAPKWVGMDLVFERHEGEEPELHVIIRSSEKRPEFPVARGDSQKQSLEELELVPALAPGPRR